MSTHATNPLWRRAVVLSLARSELAGDQLTKACRALFENEGALLQELIRTVMAVDTEPASRFLTVQDPSYLKMTRRPVMVKACPLALDRGRVSPRACYSRGRQIL